MLRVLTALLAVMGCNLAGAAVPADWQIEWPKTDFEKTSVAFSEIISGGPPKDGIPPIDNPQFVSVDEVDDLPDTEPVIGLTIDGEMKAYPLRILMWHEIVNDVLAGVPVTVTFCPLCNATIVFDRRVGERVLDFGTTGKLRNSDLVMWDRQTESWWQQALGRAIVGHYTGTQLAFIPSRLESWSNFKTRANPRARVLVPSTPSLRAYGRNPYAGYDSGFPFLYRGTLPEGIEPLARVVTLEGRKEAWTLELLREQGSIVTDDGVRLSWTPGQNSALDTSRIAQGRDVGNVTAVRDGRDVVYFVDFAFVFHAFAPDAPLHR